MAMTPWPQPAVTSATSPLVAVPTPQLGEWATLLKQMPDPLHSVGEVKGIHPKHSSMLLVVLGKIGIRH